MSKVPNNYTQLHAVIYVYLYVALYGDKKKSLDEIEAIKILIKDWLFDKLNEINKMIQKLWPII